MSEGYREVLRIQSPVTLLRYIPVDFCQHIVYTPSSIFSPFHSSDCPPYFFFSFQISSITSQHVSSALGNVHEMLDRLLTQRILSATTLERRLTAVSGIRRVQTISSYFSSSILIIFFKSIIFLIIKGNCNIIYEIRASALPIRCFMCFQLIYFKHRQ